MGTAITKPLTEAQKKALFAAKYKEVTLDLQKFFDGLGALCEDNACETLLSVQTDFIVCMTPLILSTVGQATPIPLWVSKAALVLSGFLAGFGAMMTDTASAMLVRYFGFALGIMGFLYFVVL